ncbi:MAG: RNA-binding cell elongation regulator Jag/EloR [Chloroflexota bacterium]
MENLEASGKTVEEATKRALDELGVSKEEVNITVIKEGKSGGFLGLGGEEAVVRVERKTLPKEQGDIAGKAKEILETLLKLMDVSGTVEAGPSTGDVPVTVNIKGDDLGILIGRRGQGLASLQYIARLILSHQTKMQVPVVIDIEGYKQRRYQALENLALRLADQVKSRGTSFTLEAMPSNERRVIHLALANNPDVYTESTGEGESRRVVILPKKR